MEAGEFQNLPPFPLRRVGHPELQTDFKRTAGNYFAAFSACAVSLIAGVIRKAGPPAQCDDRTLPFVDVEVRAPPQFVAEALCVSMKRGVDNLHTALAVDIGRSTLFVKDDLSNLAIRDSLVPSIPVMCANEISVKTNHRRPCERHKDRCYNRD